MVAAAAVLTGLGSLSYPPAEPDAASGTVIAADWLPWSVIAADQPAG